MSIRSTMAWRLLLAVLLISVGWFYVPTAQAAGPTIDLGSLNGFISGGSGSSAAAKVEIAAVLPRTCQGLSAFLIASGYSNTADDVRLQYENLPGWTFVASPYNTGDVRTVTLYRDNVSLGPVVLANFGTDYHFIPTYAGTHTWRVDTYSQNLVPPGGLQIAGNPVTIRGRDVVQTTPDDTCSTVVNPPPPPPPPVEVCGDGIDNNGNGQVDENCQPGSITFNQPIGSCIGSNPQISLSWSPPVGGAPLGSGGYNIFRDGIFVSNTSQTNAVDTNPLPGSHTYVLLGYDTNVQSVGSNFQQATTPSCGQPPVQGIQVGLTGPTTLRLGTSYTYTAQVTDNTGQSVSVPAGAIQWQLLHGIASGSIVNSQGNPADGILSTTTNCLQAKASDGVMALVTMTLNGQVVTTTGSLPVVFDDTPCSTPPPPPPPVNGIVPRISGPQTLRRSSTYGYTAEVQVNGLPAPVVGPGGSASGTYAEIVDWSVISSPVIGSMDPVTGILTTGSSSSIGRTPGTILVRLRVFIAGVPTNTSATLPVAMNDASLLTILGDIFGRGVQGLNVGRNSVVSSSGTVAVNRDGGGSDNLNIQGYDPRKQLSWATIQRTADAAIARLVSERGKVPQLFHPESVAGSSLATFNITSQFNLNPDSANPEGGVWHIPGNLQINGPVTFTGRGTFIVDGTVTVVGSINYATPTTMLGVISRYDSSSSNAGNAITLTGSLGNNTLLGAYFAPHGTIAFNAGLSGGSATGLFVGDMISMDDPLLNQFQIQYDGKITQNPPPGFTQSFVPALNETAP